MLSVITNYSITQRLPSKQMSIKTTHNTMVKPPGTAAMSSHSQQRKGIFSIEDHMHKN